MDDIEITVFDEIKDYKEKIYFFNFRQWIFAILIAVIVIPTYIILKDKIGEEITSYIVIAIAGSLGFIGFVKIHELEAEKILPYWFRHYFLFAKPIHYISDEEYILNSGKVESITRDCVDIDTKTIFYSNVLNKYNKFKKAVKDLDVFNKKDLFKTLKKDYITDENLLEKYYNNYMLEIKK